MSVKLRTSDRDLLLILGILVAVIITITTWLHDSRAQASQISPPPGPKINSSQVVKKISNALLNLTIQAK